MDIDKNTRLNTYRKLPEVLQELYGSETAGELLRALHGKFSLSSEMYVVYVNLIGDTILGFYKTTDLPKLFQSQLGMSADDSQRLMSELIEFLSPVIKREQESTNIKKEDIKKLADAFEEANLKRPKEVAPEGKPEGVAPLRTMQGDMNRIHGYGAAQKQQTADDEPVIQATAQTDLTNRTAPTAAVPPPTATTNQSAVQNIPIQKVE